MRKHHNKLFYGKYRYKNVFDMPWAGILYPTTDENLQEMIDGKQTQTKYLNTNFWPSNWKVASNVIALAKFIMNNRTKMKFRLQQNKAIFYSDKGQASKLVCDFWEYWKGSTTVNPNAKKLDKNIIVCSRLPHGFFKYQVHLKKDSHKYLSHNAKQNLWNFLIRNTNDCLVSSKAMISFLTNKDKQCFQGYFYVTDAKMLTPIYMMAGKSIDKVIKFEKVKNASN